MNQPIKCYLIGRSEQRVDIVIDDPECSVSSLHAELVQSRDNRWYLTDCATINGTYVLRRGIWEALRQDFVEPGERLRLGDFDTTVDWLIQQAQHCEQSASRRSRDPLTGELYSQSDP